MKKVYRIISATILMIPSYVFGQESKLSYSDLEGEVSKATKSGVTIVESIIGVILAIGLINAIYQSASGKHESREKIVGWGVGVLLYIIGIIIINKIVL
jgi:hypothetical protein